MALRAVHRGIGFGFAMLLLTSACSTPGDDSWMISWPPASFADETGPVEGPPNVGTYVTTASVAFRDGASSGVRIISVLPAGTTVATDGRELYGWWGVDYQGVAGWIYGSYLKSQ